MDGVQPVLKTRLRIPTVFTPNFCAEKMGKDLETTKM